MILPEKIERRLSPKLEFTFRELKKLSGFVPQAVYDAWPNIQERWIFLEYEHTRTHKRIIIRTCQPDYKSAKKFVREKLQLSRDWALYDENDEPVIV